MERGRTGRHVGLTSCTRQPALEVAGWFSVVTRFDLKWSRCCFV